MSVLNFLFGNRTASGFSLEGLVEFTADLTIEENHERRATVTENPIESGATISDQVILQPERLRLTGFVTDARAAVLGADPGRTQGAFETLDQVWSDRQPVMVVTARKSYDNMVITSLDLPYNRPESMEFSIDLQNVDIVESGTAEIISGENDAGRQPTRQSGEATTQAAEQAQSTYTSFLGGFF